MSVHISAWAWQQQLGDFGAKLLLLKLADNANDEGVCWPGQDYLGRECEMSERTVRRKLGLLVELGFVKILARGDGRSSSRYLVGEGGQIGRSGAATLAAQGSQAGRPGVPLLAGRTVIEPSKKKTARGTGKEPCESCGVGGGLHVADCEHAFPRENAR